MKIVFTVAVYEHAARFFGGTSTVVRWDVHFFFQALKETYLEYLHQRIFMSKSAPIKRWPKTQLHGSQNWRARWDSNPGHSA